jgi:predicted nucleic acid-binding protein
MTPVFADTFFFLALINPRDAAHQAAVSFIHARPAPLVTTAWVLTELADGLAGSRDRPLFPKILADLDREPPAIVVPPTQDLFERGKRLYLARQDKQWSLTDCISFVVMQDRGLAEALTADHHFEQAGFTALLK